MPLPCQHFLCSLFFAPYSNSLIHCWQLIVNCATTHTHLPKFKRGANNKSACIPLVVTYHLTLPTFQSTTNHHLTILHVSKLLKKPFLLLPLIAFCHPRNLNNLLVWTTLVSTLHEPPGNTLCGAIRCKTCPTCILLTPRDCSRLPFLRWLYP